MQKITSNCILIHYLSSLYAHPVTLHFIQSTKVVCNHSLNSYLLLHRGQSWSRNSVRTEKAKKRLRRVISVCSTPLMEYYWEVIVFKWNSWSVFCRSTRLLVPGTTASGYVAVGLTKEWIHVTSLICCAFVQHHVKAVHLHFHNVTSLCVRIGICPCLHRNHLI